MLDLGFEAGCCLDDGGGLDDDLDALAGGGGGDVDDLATLEGGGGVDEVGAVLFLFEGGGEELDLLVLGAGALLFAAAA